MAHPTQSQEDYSAIKKRIVKNLFERDNNRTERKEQRKKLDQEVTVPEEELRKYVDDMIRKDLRNSSCNTLIEAKNNPKAIGAYYNFINAYLLYKKGDHSFGNICCLAIESAEKILKAEIGRKIQARKNKRRRT